jgi:hypothetical protein
VVLLNGEVSGGLAHKVCGSRRQWKLSGARKFVKLGQ